MLHPVCPFVTETLWPHVHRLEGFRDADGGAWVAGLTLPLADRCVIAGWPQATDAAFDTEAETAFERVQALVAAIRNLRGERQVSPKRRIDLHVPASLMDLIAQADGVVETLAGLGSIGPDTDAPTGALPLPFEGGRVLVSNLVDEVDLDQERDRLQKTIEAKRKQVAGFQGRLANPGYVNNAKPELVEETRRMLAAAEADLAAAEEGLAALS